MKKDKFKLFCKTFVYLEQLFDNSVCVVHHLKVTVVCDWVQDTNDKVVLCCDQVIVKKDKIKLLCRTFVYLEQLFDYSICVVRHLKVTIVCDWVQNTDHEAVLCCDQVIVRKDNKTSCCVKHLFI